MSEDDPRSEWCPLPIPDGETRLNLVVACYHLKCWDAKLATDHAYNLRPVRGRLGLRGARGGRLHGRVRHVDAVHEPHLPAVLE
jgi:hypothetical protein